MTHPSPTRRFSDLELEENGCRGRGEAAGIPYQGETAAGLNQQIEQVRVAIESDASRDDLLQLLPAGGARNALDAALWDLEARQSGMRVRSEEHTSELQSLMRSSYAVFCLKK